MNNLASILITIVIAAGCGSSKPKQGPDPGPEPEPMHGEIACTSELALACDPASADGCLDGKTLFHACVLTTETAGPPCEQEIAKVCGDGQVDACLATPVMSDKHVCVFPNAAPVSSGPSCPAGQGHFVPGCGGANATLEAEGCYASCADGAACGAGFTCKTVNTNPCAGKVCAACGVDSQLCIPSA